METCICAAYKNGEIGEIIDLMRVSDGHVFGPDEDGCHIHIETHGEFRVTRGKQYQDSPVMPLTINGCPASMLRVHADGMLHGA